MATGTVKWFDKSKGYGFIANEEGGEVYVHFKAVQTAAYESLSEGQVVRIEVDDRGYIQSPPEFDIPREYVSAKRKLTAIRKELDQSIKDEQLEIAKLDSEFQRLEQLLHSPMKES